MFSTDAGDGVRLVLPLDSDADALFTLVDAERERLAEWMPWAAEQTIGKQRDWLRQAREQVATGRAYAAVIFVDGDLAGTIDIRIDGTGVSGELGYWLGSAYEGRGVMTRAVRTVTSQAFGRLGLRRVEIRTAPANTRSRAIPERLGFTREGLLRDAERTADGRYRDIELWTMLAPDWSG
jgi:ribosomal-protein-serine acetyltransferase